MATLTRCEQAAADLLTLQAAQLALATGNSVAEARYADKDVRYTAADNGLILQLIRKNEAIVDACNGVRARNRFIRTMPTDC